MWNTPKRVSILSYPILSYPIFSAFLFLSSPLFLLTSEGLDKELNTSEWGTDWHESESADRRDSASHQNAEAAVSFVLSDSVYFLTSLVQIRRHKLRENVWIKF